MIMSFTELSLDAALGEISIFKDKFLLNVSWGSFESIYSIEFCLPILSNF